MFLCNTLHFFTVSDIEKKKKVILTHSHKSFVINELLFEPMTSIWLTHRKGLCYEESKTPIKSKLNFPSIVSWFGRLGILQSVIAQCWPEQWLRGSFIVSGISMLGKVQKACRFKTNTLTSHVTHFQPYIVYWAEKTWHKLAMAKLLSTLSSTVNAFHSWIMIIQH